MKTVETTIPPETLHNIIALTDRANVPWSFVGAVNNVYLLEWWVDGADTGFSIRLNRDGTWTAYGHIPLPVQEATA